MKIPEKEAELLTTEVINVNVPAPTPKNEVEQSDVTSNVTEPAVSNTEAGSEVGEETTENNGTDTTASKTEDATDKEDDKKKSKRPKGAPYWVIEWNKINEVGFCKAFQAKHELIYTDHQLIDVNGAVNEEQVKLEIIEMIAPFCTFNLPARTETLLKALKILNYVENLDVNPWEIHVLNGVLNTQMRTWSYTKEFCLNRLNVCYDSSYGGRPNLFLKFLNELLYPEDIPILQEFLGYCLIPSTQAQKALFIIGNGGEGKSRLTVILHEIFGKNMLTGSFHRIETDRFFRYNLIGKLLMVDDDMDMSSLTSTGVVKSIITAETPIDVEAKGQQSIQAKLYSRFLCLGNGSPSALYDKSDGFARRLEILRTKDKVPGRVDDPYLCEKIRLEKCDIFCWMLEGLHRLMSNNFQFSYSWRAEKNVKDAFSDTCNVGDFLNDRSIVMFGGTYSVPCATLYNSYVYWCNENGLEPLRRVEVVRWMKDHAKKYSICYDTHVRNKEGKFVRGFKGMKVINLVLSEPNM